MSLEEIEAERQKRIRQAKGQVEALLSVAKKIVAEQWVTVERNGTESIAVLRELDGLIRRLAL